MRASLRAHRNGVHAGKVNQPEGKLVDNLQRAGNCRYRLQRVHIGKAGHARNFLVQPWIVLHSAAAKREETQIDCIILATEASVMPHGFRFCQTDQSDWLSAVKSA